MSLPFLPGNTFDRKIGQNKHHLSHHFDTKNGVQMMVGEHKPGVGGIPLAGQDLRPKNSVYPKGTIRSNESRLKCFEFMIMVSFFFQAKVPISQLGLLLTSKFFVSTHTFKSQLLSELLNNIGCAMLEFTFISKMIRFKSLNHARKMLAIIRELL
jgi:hypothetical protein